MEPLGQMEKLLVPRVLQTMAAEEGSQQGRQRCVYGHSSEAGEGSFYKKRKRKSSASGGVAPFHDPVMSTGPVLHTVKIKTGSTSYVTFNCDSSMSS